VITECCYRSRLPAIRRKVLYNEPMEAIPPIQESDQQGAAGRVCACDMSRFSLGLVQEKAAKTGLGPNLLRRISLGFLFEPWSEKPFFGLENDVY
jgi:hypothetical protein